jgi:hypothetical protein
MSASKIIYGGCDYHVNGATLHRVLQERDALLATLRECITYAPPKTFSGKNGARLAAINSICDAAIAKAGAPVMTFERFKATRRFVAAMCGPGYVYAGDLFIEQVGPRTWCFTAENDSRLLSLDEAERALYDWAVRSGYAS